ncbi:Kinase family protein [Rhynchospora pubera]|uniref:Kinase family protein n=1 Tax=Rhynchospora pubera TaxID=906938 RepID=A0AAV8F2G1_9POAL|nr:Kinase family protein [Rhynchospora pubera]
MDSFRQTPLLLSVFLSILSFSASFTPNMSHYIDCGATSNTLVSGFFPRTFTADDNSNLLSAKNSFFLSNPNNSSTGSLYSTARVSTSNFKYSFTMLTNSSNVLRLHFLPFSNQSYNLSTAKFSVKALNSYILLDNFTVTDTSSPTIKEFFLWTDSSDLAVEFIAQNNSLAFVSAIEAFTAPPNFLDGQVPLTIDNAELNGDLVKQVLETVYRVNMPGPLIIPQNDTLWRTWVTDDPYILNSAVSENQTVSMQLKYNPPEGSSEEIAPQTVYNTARIINTTTDQFESNSDFNINVTWSFTVKSGYHYLIRLHFCDIISKTNSLDTGLIFTVYIMDYLPLINGLKPTAYTTYASEPFYLDFITPVTSTQNITVKISLDRTRSSIRNALLNGLEIMKVHNLSLSGTNNNSQSKNSRTIILGASIGGAIVLALILSCLVLVLCKKRQKKPAPDVKETQVMWSPMTGVVNSSVDTSSKSGGLTTIGASPRVDLGLLISFNHIKMATNNFDKNNIIGVGGFGEVYKGVLNNGTEVAVKRASSRSNQGLPEFQTEIEVLSQIRHRHLVSLIGYCDERSEMILVYEYMEKGPLRNYLYGTDLPSLSWKQRLEICIEAAKGLHYLHTGYSQTIIHRDVKSTNILLGESFLAKVSDFGLSKLGASIGETHVSTAVKGTFGYLDPEYFKTQKLTDKSDVYSFGVTLLEVLSARPVIDQTLPREEINLAEWALLCQTRGQLEKIIDPRLVGKINENSLRKFWDIVEKCLKDYGMDRPAIGDVLWNLEYCLQLQETEVRREPYEDSGTSVAHFPEVPVVRRMPSSVVSHETGTSGDQSQSDIANSNVFSQLISKEGR